MIITNDIKNTFLTGTIPYSITYYRNENDALSEINPLNQTFPADPNDASSIYNYRNIGYPNSQKIWVRVDSTIDNACFGLGPYITLTVEKLPIANPVSIPRQCDNDQDGIFIFDFLMCVYRICDAYEAFQMGDYPTAIFKTLAAITKPSFSM